VQVITLNVLIILFSPFVGFQAAGSVIIGNCIGAMQIEMAKMYQKMIQLIGFIFSIIDGLIVYIFSVYITEYYTNIEEIKPDTIVMMKFLALFQIFDASQGVTSGILRGLGKTKHASIVGLFSYWVLALPMEYQLAFHYKLEVLGLWQGLMFGSISHALLQIYLVSCHYGDWV
jgi:MATE family multidrug resistance protein